MLKARDFRKQAWNSLNGLWGTMALVTLVFVAIMSLSGGIPFGFYIIGGPLTLGNADLYEHYKKEPQARDRTAF